MRFLLPRFPLPWLLFSMVFVGPLPGGPAITVYNADFGVVRDSVPLDLQPGENEVSYSGVTAKLEPESVVLRDPAGTVALSVLEQSYRGDPVDQARLLRMFEGETIRFLKVLGDTEELVEGRILRAPTAVGSVNRSGNARLQRLEPIIEVEGALMTQLPGEPLFPSLGDDSVLLPTLSWKLHADRSAKLNARLSYLTNGMSWKADYNLVLPEAGDSVRLTGWVSIENHTGKAFKDASIKLIAGDVNKVEDGRSRGRGAMMEMARASLADAPPAVEEKKFDAFRMYTLPRPTTLRDRETKQVEFVRAAGVATRELFVYEGFPVRHFSGLNTNQNYGNNARPDVAVYREIENREANGLGHPLPAGKMRFYRMDEDGQLEFTGENTIDHTPKNETIRLYLGNAFDLVGERKRTDFYKHPSRDLLRESFEIEIRNRSEATVTVRVVEHLFRWSNWEILEPSVAFEKTDAQTIKFPLTVPPDGSETVRYTVEYTW